MKNFFLLFIGKILTFVTERKNGDTLTFGNPKDVWFIITSRQLVNFQKHMFKESGKETNYWLFGRIFIALL
jgi:hypothetical protein